MKRKILPIILIMLFTFSENIISQSLSVGVANHTIVTNSSGQVFAWGRNNLGQFGTGDSTNSNVLVPVNMSGVLSGKTITKVRTGYFHTLVLTSDGEVFSWGTIHGYALGNGSTGNVPNPVAVDMSGVLAGKTVVDISAGYQFSICVADDGKIYSWGANRDGQLGNSTTSTSLYPTLAQNEATLKNKTITKIVSGESHTLALSSQGRLYTFGSNEFKQLGVGGGHNDYFEYPCAVLSDEDTNRVFTDIAAGKYFNLVLENDGTVHTWGRNNIFGSLGNNSTAEFSSIISVDASGVLAGKTIVKIACGYAHAIVLTSDNLLFAWGSNAFGELGNGDGVNDYHRVPVAVDMTGALAGKTITDISAGENHTFVLTSENKVYTWGRNTYGQLCDGTNTDSNVPVESVIGILPVELTSFTASAVDGKVSLNWQTATELNNYGFEIQKQESESGSRNSEWKKIGFVDGAGNSNLPKRYSFVDDNITNGKVKYRLKQIDNDGTFEYSNEVEVSFGAPTEFTLEQNYPNPFNPSTTIKFSIPESDALNASATLKIYDVLGNEVATLINENKPAGNYEVNFDASNLSSGLYFYTLTSGSFQSTKKMMLLK